jgi:hypothetical protein
MRIFVELPEPQADKLRGEAQRLGVRPEDLATAAVVDLLNREVGDFDAAARYVLKRNRELYERLESNNGDSTWRRSDAGPQVP